MVQIKRMPNSEEIAEAITDNDGYCVCAVSKNPDTKCMCKDFREQSEGVCHCGLYKKIIIDN